MSISECLLGAGCGDKAGSDLAEKESSSMDELLVAIVCENVLGRQEGEPQTGLLAC